MRPLRLTDIIFSKCGAEKPSCDNCLKSGRSCAGYQKTQIFIPSHYTKSSNDKARTLDAPLSLSRRQHGYINRQYTIAALPQAVSARNATRDQFLANLIDRQLPSCILTSGHLNDHRKWLIRLPNIAPLKPEMEYAILALSTAALEQDGDLGHGRGQSLKLYTRGLYELQKAIHDPQMRFDDQTLAACVLLGMFEFSECPGRSVSAYMRHYQGAMALLQLRGPEQHIGGLAHDVFQVLRMHTAFQGLAQGYTNQLTKPTWMEGPWMSKSKTMHDLLLDIFLQVPELLSRTRAVISSPLTQSLHTSGLKTLTGLLALDEQLNQWFESYQYTYPTPYWPKLSTANSSTDSEELGRLYQVSFEFPSYHVAETMILYWTVQILIHASMTSFCKRLTSSELKHIKGSEGYEHSAKEDDCISINDIIEKSDFLLWPETSAQHICQSVEYFFQEEFRGIGAGVVLSPLLVVKACLSMSAPDCSREIIWIDETIGRIHGNGAELAACI
ncbi:C6 zinc finger domain containing protein [Fusarium agapanthi]|uniref:C6 zinc finger domain containing protein n=1 Tax=Fusarium agapanthi TaxID=1803897 RepID=A0A9P5BD42_9HYPO|nr:C6 zinc finger domain containing protein [Fusarium agapanthi]